MKISRASASVLTVAALSLLAACGGGGGGGGVTPPGGGNGGGGGSTPTPVPTATPTPGGGGGIGVSSQVLSAEINFINGDMSWYTSGKSSWSNHSGVTSSAPQGSGTAADGMTCNHTPEGVDPSTGQNRFPAGKLTEHAFVGIIYNGTEEALPQALGMTGPIEPSVSHNGGPDTYEVEDNTCEFQMHTHDYSGLVHIEDVNLAQSTSSLPAYATLQNLMDVSGFSLSATGLTAGSNSLTGAVTIYAGTPSHKDNGNDVVDSYAPATASVNFSTHMAVWIVIGTPPAAGLPQVKFVIVN